MSIACPEPLAAIVAHYEKLSPAKLERLGDVYSPNVHFLDPIREARGIAGLRSIYQEMFNNLSNCSMEVIDAQGDEHSGFILWTLFYHYRGKDRSVSGTSHVKFASDGRIAHQQDHWDATFCVYGEIPLLGGLLRFFHRRLKVACITPEPAFHQPRQR
ncbi:nuclear transport factor 2 family protein [Luteolibacter sp. LG18]|uniref:nuclear transport factor 2 family protein n=1 Tax=Luteolibacter sp. LG18 TaxID=2819286 RepID=UPI002B30DEC1|nr:hypothetical protein llg_20130 [Luteolibacter sp. LG18]